MLKRVILSGVLTAMSLSTIYGRDTKIYELTEQEQIQLLNEADDFIDEIPEGFQDRQADAVLHALQGSASELQAVRMSRDASIKYSSAIEVKDINPLDGGARGVNMRLYIPKEVQDRCIPLLIYMHGGGWTFGSLNSCATFCDALASTGNIAVLAVDYSLAPENPFPNGLADCISAVEYAFANAEELGTSQNMISLGGDSSGGNLALATAIYFAENKGAEEIIKSLVLYYPVISVENENVGSWKKYGRGYGLDRRLMEAFISAYNNGKTPDTLRNIPKEMLVSPLKASDDLLKQIPPILMISAERDILFDQCKAFCDKIKKMGNSVDRVEFPGAVHLFITVPGQPTALKKAVELTSYFLNE